MMQRILIVEDDVAINNLIKESLEQSLYMCDQAFSGSEAKLLLEKELYALVILDLMLPGLSGEELLQNIRENGNIRVIIVTAKDDLDNRLKLLLAGADDYITKPFDIRELVVRVQVQFRHLYTTESDNILMYNGMVFDKDNYIVTVDGKEIPQLTKQELEIIELFLKHPTKVFSKESIYEYAWDEPYMGETKTIDVHISNIRKKLKKISDKDYIETVWGIGYRLHQ